MHEYVSLHYGIHCNSHLVYCHGKVYKVLNINPFLPEFIIPAEPLNTRD